MPLYLLRFIQWNNSISLKTIKLEWKDDKILFMKMTKMCGFIKQRFTCKCLKITTFKQTSYRWHANHTGDMAQFISQALSTRETVCMRMSRASIGVAMNVDMYAPGVHLPNQNVSNQNFRVNICQIAGPKYVQQNKILNLKTVTSHYLNHWCLVYWRICVTRPQIVIYSDLRNIHIRWIWN